MPIHAECINPSVFAGKSLEEIATLKIWEGNKEKALGDLFHVQGSAEDPAEQATIRLSGNLTKVRMIGAKMDSGKIVIEGDVGMHLGEAMKGGEITVKGNADSRPGGAMEGGKIEISGSAGEYVGAPYRGSTNGMKDGAIIIHGGAGNEAGCFMKGGLIKVYGNIGDFAGIHMRDGTILVQGDCAGRAGAEMLGGKIILCGYVPSVLPTFSIDSIKSSTGADGEKIRGPFYRFTGDIAENGEGKLFVSKPKNPHLSSYERYL